MEIAYYTIFIFSASPLRIAVCEGNLRKRKTYYRRNNFPGSIMMPFRRSKTPSSTIPSKRKGSVSIQKMGYNIKATIANGQQSINRIIQAMNVNIE